MESETLAIALSNDSDKLLARLRETVRVLNDRYVTQFRRKDQRYSFAEKRLYGINGFYLQWRLRDRPDEPETYENQQTSVGSVYLENVAEKRDSKPEFDYLPIDAQTGVVVVSQ